MAEGVRRGERVCKVLGKAADYECLTRHRCGVGELSRLVLDAAAKQQQSAGQQQCQTGRLGYYDHAKADIIELAVWDGDIMTIRGREDIRVR